MTNREILINDLNNLFDGFIQSKNLDIENNKISTNRFNSIMMYLYDVYISKLEVTIFNGKKQYSYIDYYNICDWYINKCLYYDIISIYGFALLINRNMTFLYNIKDSDGDCSNMFIFDVDESNIIINNPTVEDNKHVVLNAMSNGLENNMSINMDGEEATMHPFNITKKLFEVLTQSTVNKLNDTTIGLVTNANNNKDIGLLYAKERIKESAKARLVVNLSDLPQLE